MFDNGVALHHGHLHQSQTRRYSSKPVRLHEPMEELWFQLLVFDAVPGDMFLNLGAAAGYYSILALRLRPRMRVIAVNPHPKFQVMLRQNAAIAHLNVTDALLGEAFPAPGTILQLPYAVSAQPRSSPRSMAYIGEGWGDVVQLNETQAKRLASGFGFGGRPRNSVRVRTVQMRELVQLGRQNLSRILLANFDIQGHEEALFASADVQHVLAMGVIRRVIVGTHGCDFGTRTVRCADFGPRAAARHGCDPSRPGEVLTLGRLLRKNSTECGRPHAVVLLALRQAGYRILFEATQLQGQPDGLVVAVKQDEPVLDAFATERRAGASSRGSYASMASAPNRVVDFEAIVGGMHGGVRQ